MRHRYPLTLVKDILKLLLLCFQHPLSDDAVAVVNKLAAIL